MDNFTDALLRSLKRNGTEYSDLLIRGPDTQTVCRLVLDPFSGTLYSSSPAIYARIEAEVARRHHGRGDRMRRLWAGSQGQGARP
jgi:conjugal transfer ATP-binding protein TraC